MLTLALATIVVVLFLLKTRSDLAKVLKIDLRTGPNGKAIVRLQDRQFGLAILLIVLASLFTPNLWARMGWPPSSLAIAGFVIVVAAFVGLILYWKFVYTNKSRDWIFVDVIIFGLLLIIHWSMWEPGWWLANFLHFLPQ